MSNKKPWLPRRCAHILLHTKSWRIRKKYNKYLTKYFMSITVEFNGKCSVSAPVWRW